MATEAASEPLTLRDRIVSCAAEITTAQGWASVTMSKLAAEVGVSRQTVYNEVGGKPSLAEAMILTELSRFLDLVNTAFDDNPDDVVGAIRDASCAVLEFAEDNRLLHAVVSATHGADTELLPLLTTHSESLLQMAKAVVVERVEPYRLALAQGRLEPAIDMVVRVVLSHVMQPSGPPEETSENIAWIAARVLRG